MMIIIQSGNLTGNTLGLLKTHMLFLKRSGFIVKRGLNMRISHQIRQKTLKEDMLRVRTRTNYGCGFIEAGEVSLCSCSARTQTIA